MSAVVNQTLQSLYCGSLEIKLTVPLIKMNPFNDKNKMEDEGI